MGDQVHIPFRFIFHEEADVDYVKDRLDGEGNDPYIWPMLDAQWYEKISKDAYVNDGPEVSGNYAHYDSDRGIKDFPGTCVDNWGLMRVYARTNSGKNYNVTLGYYVIASSHIDRELLSGSLCQKRYKSYETHEDKWEERIEDNLSDSPYDWDVGDSFWMGNEALYRSTPPTLASPSSFIRATVTPARSPCRATTSS